MLRTFFQASRAARNYGSALRLQKQGKPADALMAASKALSYLRAPGVDRCTPHSLSIGLGIATLIDTLASQMGDKEQAREVLIDAKRVWGLAVAKNPALANTDVGQQYVRWFDHRLREES